MARILTEYKVVVYHTCNLLKAIIPAIKLSENPKMNLYFYCICTPLQLRDVNTLKENTYATAAAWIAFGFNTDKNIFTDSLIFLKYELMWYLNCITLYILYE